MRSPHSVESDHTRVRSASLIRFHLQNAEVCDEDRADLLALADSLDATDDSQMDVWRFAHDFARPSGDSPECRCVNCRAWRAVREDAPTKPLTTPPGQGSDGGAA